jgi:hypothetical protein
MERNFQVDAIQLKLLLKKEQKKSRIFSPAQALLSGFNSLKTFLKPS